MREYILRDQQQAQKVASDEGLAMVVVPEKLLRRRLRGPVRQKDFIVSYDGRFIGHFRAHRPSTVLVAFGQVARELRAQRPDFNPELLALYRPVKLRVKSHTGAEEAAAGGAFHWFQTKGR